MDPKSVNAQISELVERWCERRDLGSLAGILPEWLANNGLTDGWGDLGKACRALSSRDALPDAERAILKKLWIEIDTGLRDR